MCALCAAMLSIKLTLFQPADNVIELTAVFVMLVMFSATQDIAVDGELGVKLDFHTMLTSVSGWALTLLSQDCLSYASTCQTIGLHTGFFSSFTVFLAFNSEEFA